MTDEAESNKKAGKKQRGVAPEEFVWVVDECLLFIKQQRVDPPEGLQKFSAKELASLMKTVTSRFVGDAEADPASRLINALEPEARQVTRAVMDAHVQRIRLAGRLSRNVDFKTTCFASALVACRKNPSMAARLVESLGASAGEMLAATLRKWIEGAGKKAALEEDLRSWASAIQPLLVPSLEPGERRSGKLLRTEDADAIVTILTELEPNSIKLVNSVEFLSLVPAATLFASDELQNRFKQSELWRRLGLSAGGLKSDREKTPPERSTPNVLPPAKIADSALLDAIEQRLSDRHKALAEIDNLRADIEQERRRTVQARVRGDQLEKELRETMSATSNLKAKLADERGRREKETEVLRKELETSTRERDQKSEDLEDILHQKMNTEEHFRQEFAESVRTILEGEGKSAWERVCRLGDDHKHLRINLKNVFNRIARLAGVRSPAG